MTRLVAPRRASVLWGAFFLGTFRWCPGRDSGETGTGDGAGRQRSARAWAVTVDGC